MGVHQSTSARNEDLQNKLPAASDHAEPVLNTLLFARQRPVGAPVAADYLQLDRETIYRYIRQGKLVASKLGRAYRIPKRTLDLLLWTTRTRQDITLREYTGEEVADFLRADELDHEAQEITKRFA